MTNIIVGTAGHIDHGKTALVRALTGIDTDRLEEEKRRGISIDLGFAHLDLAPDLRIGFVDVPGHERFIKNMLAGVGGIDLVLFVIAADESIKPQTREHFDICRLLGIPRGIVALTKSDLVDREIVDLARLEIEEFVAGSFLAGSPVVPVSSTTGEGLDELRRELEKAARAVPPKDSSRYLRLPIDRVFSMRGFGTVVTGTLISGSVRREQEVEAQPLGRRLKVRGIQVHGAAEECALAGQRTALNLSGAEPADLARGMVLVEPGRFAPSRQFDCVLELLPSAKPLKHRAPVHFHAGTAEIEAEVRLLEAPRVLQPGARAYARLFLREPALLVPGDRFIIRMFSPVVTIGGGVVLDIAPPLKRRDHAARLKILSEGSPADRVALLVREAPHGLAISELVARTALPEREIRAAAQSAGLVFLSEPRAWLVGRPWCEAAIKQIESAVREFHRQNPLLPGIARQDLRGRVLGSPPPFLFDFLIAEAKAVVSEGEIVRLATHRLALKEDEEQAVAILERVFLEAGLKVPSLPEALAQSKMDPARARGLLQILLRSRKLVKIGDDFVFHRAALDGLRGMLAERKGRRFLVPEFKEWTGISRKYAIPLLEYLDREHVTRREGDQRLVL
jgi:selenocysteine-specific elongation factor